MAGHRPGSYVSSRPAWDLRRSENGLDKAAGVWLDGQYVGYVGDLRGGDRLVLVPGKHELLFRLVGYEDLRMPITAEPGEWRECEFSMAPRPGLTYPDEDSTARVRIDVQPEDAAIFVNEVFVGRVDRFDGRRGMRMPPGTYRFTVALPGYQACQTELTVRSGQTCEVRTALSRGRLSDRAAELIATNPGAAR